MQKHTHGAFLIFPFQDKYVLFRRGDNAKLNLVGGGMDFPEIPAETVVRESAEEVGLLLEYKNISIAGILVQRIPPIKDNVFGFCFIYEPTNPFYLLKYGSTFEQLCESLVIDQNETTEIVLLSIEEIINSEEVTLATKRILARYELNKKKEPKRIFEGFLRDSVYFGEYEI